VSNFTKKFVCSFTDRAAIDPITDPEEEYPATELRNSENAGPAMKIVTGFEESLKRYPLIPPGAPDPYTQPKF